VPSPADDKHSLVHLGHPVDYAVVVEDMRYL
jgi:hypothetical protein